MEDFNKLKFSKFNILLLWKKRGDIDIYLIFNTLSKAMCLVSSDFVESIKNKTPLEIEYQKIVEDLKKSGILINKTTEEEKIFKYWLNKIKFSRGIQVTLLTTHKCNLNCKYCYQKVENNPYIRDFKKNYNMDKKIAKQTINFLSNLISKEFPPFIHIEFYGGEPLLNIPIMDYIISKIIKICSKFGVHFTFGIMTNGLLLKRELIKRLKEKGLSKLQVTLDGSEKEHNRRRPLKSSKGSFSKIIRGIKEVAHLVPTIVRVNVDENNSSKLPNLFSYLDKSGLKDLISIYLVPTILNTSNSDNIYSCKDCLKQSWSNQTLEDVKETIRLAAEKGFSLATKFYSVGPCHFYMDRSFAIDSNGDIYKCLAMGKTSLVGNVKSSKLNYKHIKAVETNIWEKCDDCGNCVYLPLCLGGCRYQAILRGGYNEIFCIKNVFEELTPLLVKVYVKKQKERI